MVIRKLNALVLVGVWGVVMSGARPAVAGAPVPHADLEKIRKALPMEPLAAPQEPRRVLIYTDCKGFVHDAIPYATAMLTMLGRVTGAYTAIASEDPSVFDPEKLGQYDAIVFNNTTGELFDDPKYRESLLAFVRGGKGVVGIHAATDCFYTWPEFGEMMGGYFDGHPWHEKVMVKVDDPHHPLTMMFRGRPFEVVDEIYQFKEPYSREKLRVLLSLDASQLDLTKPGIKRTDRDFAVSWIREYGDGRVFYCSLGHDKPIFWDPALIMHFLNGVQYAIGDLEADATPSAKIANAGWEWLFNRKDLKGWICKPDGWKVERGALKRAAGGDIWTQETFGDFQLELEFRLAPGANSGVFFRTADIQDPVQTGIEVQLLDATRGKTEPGKHDCGAIYDIAAPARDALRPEGFWNHLLLQAQGSKILVLLNAQKVVEIDLDDWTEPGRNPDGTANKFRTAYKDMPREGRIGFQDHGNPIEFKNIRIKRLED